MRAIDDPFDSLPTIGTGTGEGEQKFLVRRSDIDTNGHVNNSNYLQWMLEVVPEDIYQNDHLASLEIQYKKETTYGSSIRSKCLIEDLDPLQPVCRHVILGEDSGQELAIGKTMWVRRNH